MLIRLVPAALLATVLATAGQAQTAASATEPDAFAMMAASSNMFEIESSQLALEKLESGDVASFAQQMVTDHKAAGEKMKAAAAADRVPVPGAMSEKHQDLLEQLQAADAEAFAIAYVEAQVTAHEEAVALFTDFSTSGEDGELKAFAEATLPTLKDHEIHVKQLEAQ